MNATTIMPADAIAATQRVQQLQAQIAQVRQGTPAASFATTLATASAATATTAATPALAGNGTATTPSGFVGIGTAAIPSAPAGTAATPSGSSGSSAYDAPIAQAAARYNIDPALLHGLIQQESGFDPNSRSSAGALGLTQLMPGTASSLGVSNPLDPVQSIEGGARYLSQMLQQFGGNTEDALAAYNAGPGAVSRYGGVPPYAETQAYVAKVLGYADAYRQTLIPTTASTGAIA